MNQISSALGIPRDSIRSDYALVKATVIAFANAVFMHFSASRIADAPPRIHVNAQISGSIHLTDIRRNDQG